MRSGAALRLAPPLRLLSLCRPRPDPPAPYPAPPRPAPRPPQADGGWERETTGSSPPEDGQRGPSGADADGDAEAPDEDGGAGLPAAPPRDARVCGIPGHPNPRVCGWT